MEYTYAEFIEMLKKSPETPEDNDLMTRTLDIIQGKWVQHILFQLCKKGSCRFGEIQKALPQISKSMLSSVLKQLESNGLVTRKQYNEIPPHTEYSLTEAGKDLMPVFYEVFKWGTKYVNSNFIPPVS
jgi:DNA-binding HxlR family transcriptional regulator